MVQVYEASQSAVFDACLGSVFGVQFLKRPRLQFSGGSFQASQGCIF